MLFRSIVVQEEGEKVTDWSIKALGSNEWTAEDLAVLLRHKRDANGQEHACVSFDFGLASRKEPEKYEAMLSALEEDQREYVSGLPWEGRRVYHKLNFRGMEMLIQLYEAGQYQGECYFLKTREILQIG